MLAAAEAAMDEAAEDDAERKRNRARLYAPPKGSKRGGRRTPVPGVSMTRAQAQALTAQLAAEDAKVSTMRSG